MPPGLKNKGFLDPKTCWKLWHELGSLGKVRKEFLRRNLINEETGNPPTQSGIEKAAFIWAINNQEEARKDLQYSWERKGHILTDEKWKQFLREASNLVYYQRRNTLKEFVSRNKL